MFGFGRPGKMNVPLLFNGKTVIYVSIAEAKKLVKAGVAEYFDEQRPLSPYMKAILEPREKRRDINP